MAFVVTFVLLMLMLNWLRFGFAWIRGVEWSKVGGLVDRGEVVVVVSRDEVFD